MKNKGKSCFAFRGGAEAKPQFEDLKDPGTDKVSQAELNTRGVVIHKFFVF